MKSAIKVFDVEEDSVEGGHYRIIVYWRGRELERFERPTMREAHFAFAAAGYIVNA